MGLCDLWNRLPDSQLARNRLFIFKVGSVLDLLGTGFTRNGLLKLFSHLRESSAQLTMGFYAAIPALRKLMTDCVDESLLGSLYSIPGMWLNLSTGNTAKQVVPLVSSRGRNWLPSRIHNLFGRLSPSSKSGKLDLLWTWKHFNDGWNSQRRTHVIFYVVFHINFSYSISILSVILITDKEIVSTKKSGDCCRFYLYIILCQKNIFSLTGASSVHQGIMFAEESKGP